MKINITTFIIQVVNFAILAYILYKVLYKPLREIMEKRKRLVMVDVERALKMKDDAIKTKETYERLLKETEAFRKAQMDRALEDAEEMRRKVLEEAAREAAAEKEKAAAVIENERKEMLAAFGREAAEISTELASRLLADISSEALHRRLTELMMKELEDRLPIMPAHRVKEGAKAVCAAAYCMDEKDSRSIESLIRECMGPGVRIEHRVEPELIAGLRLWLDGMVLDGSLKGQLVAFRDRVAGGLGGNG